MYSCYIIVWAIFETVITVVSYILKIGGNKMINQNHKSESKSLGNFNGKSCLNTKPPKKEKNRDFYSSLEFFIFILLSMPSRKTFIHLLIQIFKLHNLTNILHICFTSCFNCYNCCELYFENRWKQNDKPQW